MWPFCKKQVLPPPEDIVMGGDRASFSTSLDQWEFEIDGTEFTISGRDFDNRAFTWARETAASIKQLKSEIDRQVLEVLYGWPCDVSTRRILSVCLDDFASERQAELAFVGDDSWGDFGVNVIIAGGKVIEAYGGD